MALEPVVIFQIHSVGFKSLFLSVLGGLRIAGRIMGLRFGLRLIRLARTFVRMSLWPSGNHAVVVFAFLLLFVHGGLLFLVGRT